MEDKIIKRAKDLCLARHFFATRSIIEVDCPLMAKSACIDLHIDLLKVTSSKQHIYYLHSSPEYFMKRLLADYDHDIYQLFHVFRDEEVGPIHNVEFMMAEWYRRNFSLDEMIEETIEFIQNFLYTAEAIYLTYREAIYQYAHIDYVKASSQDLYECLIKHDIIPYDHIMQEGKDALLNLIMGTLVEPKLKTLPLVIIKHFPASQAALAKKRWIDDEEIGLRFEIYSRGIELANGYEELLDAKEQRERLEKANEERAFHQKEKLPIDEHFIKALQKGLPSMSGVAVGFDRLLMLKYNKTCLKDILPFGYDEI